MAKGNRGGRRAGGSISKSNEIKQEFLDAGLNSKFAGVRRNAQNGTGSYSFKNSTAISSNQALKMESMKFTEKNGNTLVDGLLNGKSVFYANKSSDKTIKALKDRNEQLRKNTFTKGNTDIRTTTTYDRWLKQNTKKFDAWFNGGK